MPRPNLVEWFGATLVFVAAVGYWLPWLANRSAALSANALDLAEWVGLAPAQRQMSPPMPASLALRGVLVILALLFALRGRALRHWLFWIIALILALTLTPPLEFFRGQFADPNYQQFAGLVLSALIGIGVVFVFRQARWAWRVIESGLAVVGISAALIGVSSGFETLARTGMPTPIGLGVLVSGMALMAWAVIGIIPRD